MKNKAIITFLSLAALVAVAATLQRKVSDFPNVNPPATNDIFLLESGVTNKHIRYDQLKDSINAGISNQIVTNSTVYTNNVTVLKGGRVTVTNNITLQTNGTLSLQNLPWPSVLLVGANGDATNATLSGATLSGSTITVPGGGSSVVFTNYIQMPWTTLTMSGSNVSTLDLSAGSMFKLTLAANAFFGAPSNLPGTNMAQVIQIALLEDGTGAWGVTMTNSAWVLAGSGTSTNAVPSITTNANAVTILTFVTSPFSTTKLYGVPAATGP